MGVTIVGGALQTSAVSPVIPAADLEQLAITEKTRVTTRPANKRQPSQRVRDGTNLNTAEEEDINDPVEVCNVNGTDPQTIAAAMKTSEDAQWQEAIHVELKALRDNRTWIAVPKPETAKALHTKWVFTTKTDAAGQIERFKARLVVCGNEQEEGVNYSSTFSPVMDMATTRFILALAMLWGVPPRHGDIPNAYPKAAIEKDLEIYLLLPKGMNLTEEEAFNGGYKQRCD